jgi:hypothetical protein
MTTAPPRKVKVKPGPGTVGVKWAAIRKAAPKKKAAAKKKAPAKKS